MKTLTHPEKGGHCFWQKNGGQNYEREELTCNIPASHHSSAGVGPGGAPARLDHVLKKAEENIGEIQKTKRSSSIR